MKRVNIGVLKNELSRYIGMVREGEEVLVLDRKKPVARILPLPPEMRYDAEMLELAAEGIVRLPTAPPPDDSFYAPAPPAGTGSFAVAALLADRDEARY